ncbi:heavy-metal-associated domain-containing protein [Diplocloster modestus]|uniref:Cation transporter n=1 Tax=Diplocloster modestus TaxID=2850322 RepID=A0ABS6K3F3_9FIRM|nr:heavy metal-associated domain-containing protein [Diplocloster modestus]MBU9725033.1 cation transporter [Diplocloster modestus]
MNGTWINAVICIALVLICIFSVRSYLKKLKNGCCGAGGDELKRIRPADKDTAHYSYARKIGIEGMSCKNCAMRIENAFHELDGFYAEVNLKQQYAIVYMKQEETDEDIKRVVRRAGYHVTSLEPVEYYKQICGGSGEKYVP